MKTYAFSCGDTNKGTVGAVFRIEGHSPEQALDQLKNVELDHLVEYVGGICVSTYFNLENVTLDDLVDEEENTK